MAELIRNIPPNFSLDFLSAEEEENLLWHGEDEDDFVLNLNYLYIFSTGFGENRRLFRRNGTPLSRRCFRSHFRMTPSSFETLCQLLA